MIANPYQALIVWKAFESLGYRPPGNEKPKLKRIANLKDNGTSRDSKNNNFKH